MCDLAPAYTPLANQLVPIGLPGATSLGVAVPLGLGTSDGMLPRPDRASLLGFRRFLPQLMNAVERQFMNSKFDYSLDVDGVVVAVDSQCKTSGPGSSQLQLLNAPAGGSKLEAEGY